MPNMYMNNMGMYPISYNNMPMGEGYPVNGHYMHENLVNTIQECEATCEHMTTHLKKLQDVQMRTKQLVLLRDCADICGLTAKYVARGSMFSKQTAVLCACICEACAQECMRFQDAMSQNCAQICLHCARECINFAREI